MAEQRTSSRPTKLRVGLVARQSLRSWGRNFWRLTILAAALEAPILVAEVVLHENARITIDTDLGVYPSPYAITLVVYSLLSHHFLSGLIERFVGAERHGHDEPTFVELIRDLPWLRLVLADLLLALVTAAGFLFFLLPGFIVATYFAIVLPLINLERRPILATFRRSASLVRGNGRRVFVVWLVTSLITQIGLFVVGNVVAVFTHSQAIEHVAEGVTNALLLPIAALPLVIMAFELVERDGAPSLGPQQP